MGMNDTYNNDYVEYLPSFKGVGEVSSTDNESKINEGWNALQPQSQDDLDDEAKEWLKSVKDVHIQRSQGYNPEKLQKFFNSDRACVRVAANQIRHKQDLFVQGKAGWGKTSILTEIGLACGYDVITLYLDKADAEELGGIPTIEDSKFKSLKRTEKTVPEWASEMILHSPQIMKGNARYYMLFCDEFNQASPKVMDAMMPIIRQKTVAGRQLNNFFVVAAGNYREENKKGVSDFSVPLKKRMQMVKWDENWPEAIAFLEEKYSSVDGARELFKVLKKNIGNGLHNYDLFYAPRDIEMVVERLFDYSEDDKDMAPVRSEDILMLLDSWLDDSPYRKSPTFKEDLENLSNDCWNYVKGYGDVKTEEKDKKQQLRQEWDVNKKKKFADGLVAGYFVGKKKDGAKSFAPVVLDQVMNQVAETELFDKVKMTQTTIREMAEKGGGIRFQNLDEFYKEYPNFDKDPECVLKN